MMKAGSDLPLAMRWDHKLMTNMIRSLFFVAFSPSPRKDPPRHFTATGVISQWLSGGWGGGAAHVWTPLTELTIHALVEAAINNREDAYRGRRRSTSEVPLLVVFGWWGVEQGPSQECPSRALCWFITLLEPVTEIRTSMFQSDSWPLRFTHPGGGAPVCQTYVLTNSVGHTRTIYSTSFLWVKSSRTKSKSKSQTNKFSHSGYERLHRSSSYCLTPRYRCFSVTDIQNKNPSFL